MKAPLKKIKKHKRHFQLLELMVAVFILLVSVAPMLQIYTSMYRSQQHSIRENQRDHLAHLLHAKFTEELYKNRIVLEEIKQSKLIMLNDPDSSKLLNEYQYNCTGTFTLLKRSKSEGKIIKYLGELKIEMTDRLFKPKKKIDSDQEGNPAITTYTYSIYIDSGAIDSKNKKKNRVPETPTDDDDEVDEEDEEDEEASDEDEEEEEEEDSDSVDNSHSHLNQGKQE